MIKNYIIFYLKKKFYKVKLKKFIFIISNLKFFKAYLNFVFPLTELSVLLRTLPKIDNCIDVGSNKGQFALIFQKYFNSAKIYSFEPQINGIKLQKRFLKNSKFFNLCLGNFNGTSSFNITNREDSSSLLKPKIYTKTIYKISKIIRTKVRRLDNVLKLNPKQTNLLKIDVQGYEYEVLLGSKKTLKNIKFIIIELSSSMNYFKQVDKSKIIHFLKNNNFNIKKIYNKNYNGKLWQADYLFVKKN